MKKMNRKKVRILICVLTVLTISILGTLENKEKNRGNMHTDSMKNLKVEESTEKDEPGLEEFLKEEVQKETVQREKVKEETMQRDEVQEEGVQENEIPKEQTKDIIFPYKVPGTELVIERFEGYDGIYIEDGSDEKIAGVGTIQVKNTGKESIEYAEVYIGHSGKEYKFEVTALPNGAVAVVQEKTKNVYEEGENEYCYANIATMDELEMSEEHVKVTENKDGTLNVKNLSDRDIPCVRVFYKFYMEKEDAYVGGITYTTKVNELKKGSEISIAPTHYLAGSSKIMMVRIYESTE